MAKRPTTRRNTAKEQHWRGVIGHWERSGQTIAGFCRDKDLSLASFNWWRRELAHRDGRPLRRLRNRRSTQAAPKKRRRSKATAGRARFVPVRLSGPAQNQSNGTTIESELAGGRVVRVTANVSAEALTTVVTALESVPC